MSEAEQIEQALRDLTRTGTRLADIDGARVWRFEYKSKPLLLQVFPRRTGFLSRFRGTSPAMARFRRMQWLQKAKVSAPRAIAVLMGFRAPDMIGDALIVEELAGAVPLNAYVAETPAGTPAHRATEKQVREILHRMGKARLGHSRLGLGAFCVRDGVVYLADISAVRSDGLRIDDVMRLAHFAGPIATRADRLRIWRQLQGDSQPPRTNPLSARLWAEQVKEAFDEGERFGRLRAEGWSGWFAKPLGLGRLESARRPITAALADSTQTGMSVPPFGEEDWRSAWPEILQRIERDEFEVLKRASSGDVLAGEIVVGGRSLRVVIKRPRRKFWYRYLNEIGRGSRSRRAWKKAWQLVVRGIPTAWPLLFAEKRALGYVTDQVTIYEHIDGQTLADADWNAMPDADRRTLMFRAGRLLRQVEESGLFLYDAKATNWMISKDRAGRPMPMLVDVDGLRKIRAPRGGLARLLRSVREHRHFRPADEEEIRRGYEPFDPQGA